MQRLRFLREDQYEHAGQRIGPVYPPGHVGNFPEIAVRYWLKRNAVEIVGPDVVTTRAKASSAPKRRRRGHKASA